MAETAVPGAAKDDKAMTSKAAHAVRRSQSARRASRIAGIAFQRHFLFLEKRDL
jgi:hypothetical protein